MESVILRTLFWTGGAIILTIYLYLKLIVYTYWKRKGLPHDTPNMLVGNALPSFIGQMSLANNLKESYEKFKIHKYHGLYMFCQPVLMINDPNLIRMVLVKEFQKFHDRGLYCNEKVDPLSGHLFLLSGKKWKRLRNKLSPTFTSMKIKQMVPLIQEIGVNLFKACDKIVDYSNIIEIKDLLERYTTDSICSIAFGFNCNSLDDPEHEFKHYANKIFHQHPLRTTLGTFAPIIMDIFRIPTRSKSLTRFFMHTFEDMVKYRQANKIVRNDFLHLLIQLMDKEVLDDDEKSVKNNNSVSSNEKITMAEAVAQVFVFFAAGFETSSSTATYCLYELSLNPEIQEKLQEEIDEFSKKPGGITYATLTNELEYLHMVLSETLRKHPSFAFLNRYCNEHFDIPNSDFRIEKGTEIVISVSGLHSDTNIYPDPQKFDPSRFSKENIAARNPYAYLPFGEGPRNCIGKRLGILQTKIALISLLSNFKFSVCDKTPIPIHYSKNSFVQTPENAVYLKIEKRNK